VQLGGATLFSGRIGALEGRFPEAGPAEIAVLAEDRLQDLRMTRRSRHFEQMSDADVMRQIAGDHGLSAEVDVPGGTHTVLAQVNQSDLAFLRERARATGVELWVEDTRLKARPRSGRAGTPTTLDWGGRLRSFNALADLAHQATRLTVGGWDVAGKQAIAAEADLAVVASELDGGSSGGDILEQTLGERRASLAHTVPADADEARAQAEACLASLARRFVVGRGIGETDAALKVGAAVRLQGLGALFSGQYVLSEVRHRFDETHGLRTEFTAERAGLGGRR
jgi:phage protein D